LGRGGLKVWDYERPYIRGLLPKPLSPKPLTILNFQISNNIIVDMWIKLWIKWGYLTNLHRGIWGIWGYRGLSISGLYPLIYGYIG
jgi:hypothetical protein